MTNGGEQVQGEERGAQALSPEQVEEGLNATPNESTPGDAVEFQADDAAQQDDTGQVQQSGGEQQ